MKFVFGEQENIADQDTIESVNFFSGIVEDGDGFADLDEWPSTEMLKSSSQMNDGASRSFLLLTSKRVKVI
ncbi:MAG: hypothetical protein R3220_09640 [Balneolaceae bacterium]|nr:hypothetical protein [Balneolaceae bacterium]